MASFVKREISFKSASLIFGWFSAEIWLTLVTISELTISYNNQVDFLQKALYGWFQNHWNLFSETPGYAKLEKNLLYKHFSPGGSPGGLPSRCAKRTPSELNGNVANLFGSINQLQPENIIIQWQRDPFYRQNRDGNHGHSGGGIAGNGGRKDGHSVGRRVQSRTK